MLNYFVNIIMLKKENEESSYTLCLAFVKLSMQQETCEMDGTIKELEDRMLLSGSDQYSNRKLTASLHTLSGFIQESRMFPTYTRAFLGAWLRASTPQAELFSSDGFRKN